MQHRTFFSILFSMLFIWGTEGISASKQVLITFSSGKIFADGSLSQAGAYRSKQDLLKVWGVNNKNIIEKLFSAPSDADRLSVLVQNKDQIKNLPGVSLDFTSNMVTVNQPAAKRQPPPVAPKPAKKVNVQAVTAPAAVSVVQSNPIDVQASDRQRRQQAARLLQSKWREYLIRERESEKYETEPKLRDVRKKFFEVRNRYKVAKNELYKTHFDAAEESDATLKSNYEKGPMRQELLNRGMPLVYDLKDYDRYREEIEGEDRTPSLKKSDQPRGRNRNPSPTRGPDWEILNSFISQHGQSIDQGFRGLENDGLRKKLCVCVLDPDFYSKAQGLGTIKQARLVSLCHGYAPEIAAQGEFRQRSRSASPEREQINLKKASAVRLDPPSRGRSPSPEPVVQVDPTPWVRADTPPALGAASVRTSRSSSPQRMTHAGGGANSSHVSDMTADPVPEDMNARNTTDRTAWVRGNSPVRKSRSPSPIRMMKMGGGASSFHSSNMAADEVPEDYDDPFGKNLPLDQQISSMQRNLAHDQQQLTQEKSLNDTQRKQLEGQIAEIEKNIQDAKDYYDNLIVAASIIKEDLPESDYGIGTGRKFKDQAHFQAFEKKNKTVSSENYIKNLFSYLNNNKHILVNLHPGSWTQVTAARNLIIEAQKNLRKGRINLERLNKEMLTLK